MDIIEPLTNRKKEPSSALFSWEDKDDVKPR